MRSSGQSRLKTLARWNEQSDKTSQHCQMHSVRMVNTVRQPKNTRRDRQLGNSQDQLSRPFLAACWSGTQRKIFQRVMRLLDLNRTLIGLRSFPQQLALPADSNRTSRVLLRSQFLSSCCSHSFQFVEQLTETFVKAHTWGTDASFVSSRGIVLFCPNDFDGIVNATELRHATFLQ